MNKTSPFQCLTASSRSALKFTFSLVFFFLKKSFTCTGDTEKCVKAIFSCAEEYELALIYLDELDCMLATNASENLTSSSTTLEILLKEMNRLLQRENDKIILVSSTNHPELLPENLVTR